jgi:hypothetical protein
MKSHIVIDQKGNWKLMNRLDADAYSQNSFEVHSLFNWVYKWSKMAVKMGLLIWLANSPNKFSNNDLRLAFLILILIEVTRMVRW